jgi:hypothetical protein
MNKRCTATSAKTRTATSSISPQGLAPLSFERSLIGNSPIGERSSITILPFLKTARSGGENLKPYAVMYWSKRGDWDTLANYIERGDAITPEIGSFIAGILRGEIKKPGKPATLAKLKRDFEIVRWVRAERANGKSKATALEGAAAKFNLAYDTIDDIFDAVLAEYREHIAKEKDRLASVALAWRALRAVAEEFKRRGSDGYAWVFSDSPFEGTFGELDEHL